MNILMVLSTNRYPPDRRVEREAQGLLAEGHRVWLLARRCPGQAARENVGGVEVLRVWLPFQKRRLLCDAVYYGWQRYAMLLPILRACRRHRIDALHVHDLPYAFAAALAARLLRIPLVFDMHEHYTAMLASGFESAVYRRFKALSGALLALLRAEERFAARRARKVIVVAEEHRPRIVSLGVRTEDIIEVTNTEEEAGFADLPRDPRLVESWGDDFVILYVGHLDPKRGIDTALQALPLIRERIPSARLVLVGDGVSRFELERLSERLGLQQHVTFAGFQPFRALPTCIDRCQAFLIPHISTPQVEMTMPNKIFQGMMLARPVVVSDTGPMRRVVNETQCGLVFRERDPRSLADAVIQLRDPALRQRLGENGLRAVRERYNWPATMRPLLALYSEIGRGAEARSNRAERGEWLHGEAR